MFRPIPTRLFLNRDRTYLWVAAGALFLYFLPYWWLGEGTYLTIHDQLDSDFIYLRLLAQSSKVFTANPTAVLPNVMNGLPRAALRSSFNLAVLTYTWLPSYAAWLLNFALIHTIGFVGMYALLRRYVLPHPDQSLLRVGIALVFALIPGYTVHGASVTGQPLLLLAFLNLLNQRGTWRDWLIIGLFPFYSFLVWSGLFVVILLVGLGTLVMIRRRAVAWPYLGAIVLLTGLYAAVEWQLIHAFFTETYISQRTEYDYARLLPVTFSASLAAAYQLFIKTQYHAGPFYTRLIGLVALVGIALARRTNAPRYTRRLIGGLLGLIVLICLWHGFYRFAAVWAGRGSLPQAFQFDRFYFVLPLLWLLLLALSLRSFASDGWWVRAVLLGQLVVMVVVNDEWRINLKKLSGIDNELTYPSYRAFFAERQFAQISAYTALAPAHYRVVSVGIVPAVALYNGFYCLDSYQNNYPLPYKRQFRQVIAAELAKSQRLRTYYDYYATRCYVFSAELGLAERDVIVSKYEKRAIEHLQLNTGVLRQMGCRYILAGLPIRNATDQHLRLERIFSDSDSYWKVYLYRLLDV